MGRFARISIALASEVFLLKRFAFTLIELLVVIAIIAILAAILFPVFAQAKAAAKSAAATSNEKQDNLAIIMYANDYDDTAPIDCIWGGNDAYYWFGSQGSQFSPWSYEVLPYTKNGQIFEDPQTSAEPLPTDGTPASTYWAYNPEIAYNYTALSPITNTSSTPWTRSPVSLSSLNKPSDTVAISTHNTEEEDVGLYWYGVGTLLVATYTVEAPDCTDLRSNGKFCMTGWGQDGFFSDFWLKKNRTAGAYTGMNSLRKSGNVIAGFADGHIKTMPPGSLAAGTNWNPNIAANQTVVVDASKYLWGNF